MLIAAPIRACVDLVFPRTCAACREPLCEPRIRLCDECATDLARHVGGECCVQCACDVGPHLLVSGKCSDCRAHPRPPVSRIVRVGRHRGTLRSLVLAYKHERILDDLLGDWMAHAARPILDESGINTLVAIPTPLIRRWRRGFHPADLLARQIARRTRIPVLPLLAMARRVRPQTGLSATEREENIRGAFRCVAPPRAAGRSICLVDDVSTTGATLREAARALRSAGAANVVATVVSRAVLSEPADA
jgi:ComF family protein